MVTPNYRLIATEIGNLVKYDTSVNAIERSATAIFSFKKEEFPNPAITSSRAKLIYDWILTLAKQSMDASHRNQLLINFCRSIVLESELPTAFLIIENAGILVGGCNNAELSEFSSRGFHPEIHRHCKKLFIDGHYFHSVFEACKTYNRQVQEKSKSNKDGSTLMLEVWGCNGVLKITECKTDTDKNVQDGIKFLSAGLMQAVRNPTAHEPALDWSIKKQDCLDLLSFVSFLFRQLDNAIYFKNN